MIEIGGDSMNCVIIFRIADISESYSVFKITKCANQFI